ncbi:MAG: hypothetical protein P1S46_00590 [bacterium]|nr:hypothetical protein [bacterium]
MAFSTLTKGLFVTSLALALLTVPVDGSCSWKEVDSILRQAYGPEVALECESYYGSLDIPEEQIAPIRDAVRILVEAGYPVGCPREYLEFASELARADIALKDLSNKIREGVAKKVSAERLNTVLQQRTKALQEARVIVLGLADRGVVFLDRQMAYSVIADYLLRGIMTNDLEGALLEGDLARYPALENVIR